MILRTTISWVSSARMHVAIEANKQANVRCDELATVHCLRWW